MTVGFPYDWADPLEAEELEPCRVHDLPAAGPVGPSPREALERPVGAPPLEELLRKRRPRRMLVLVDDLTRSTPQRELLPVVLETARRAGLPRVAITIMVAVGLHRVMTEAELRERFGPGVADGYRLINHDAFDAGSLTLLGQAADGTPIEVNSRVRENDFILALGGIGPHRVAGYSGGAKMIQPGICGPSITASVHWRGWLTEGEELYGVVENPIRHEMEAIADRAGLSFIVNVVQDGDGQVCGCYAGDFRRAFREGCRASARLFSVPVRRAEIVVVDSHPYDLDLWQACKAVSVAELVVKRGGTIVLVTPCPEGLSAHQEEIRRTGYLPKSEIVRRVQEGSLENLYIACHLMALGRILEHGQLLIVSSGLDEPLLRSVGLESAPSVAEAVLRARARLGAGAEIAVLRNGCKMVPVPAGREGEEIR